MTDVRRELLEKTRNKARRRRRIWQGIFGTIFILLIVGVVLFLRWEKVRVIEIVLAGNKTVQTEELKSNIVERLSGQWFYLIPKNNSLFVDKFSLGQSILTDFPDISKIEISRDGFTKLDFKVSERAPEILWCQKGGEVEGVRAVVAVATTASSTATSTPAVSSAVQPPLAPATASQGNEKCFYADKTGFIFADAPNFSGNVMFKVFGLLPAEPIGIRPLPAPDFAELLKTIDALPILFESAGLPATQAKYLSVDKYGDCRVTITGAGVSSDWQIVFNHRQDFKELASNLNTIFNSTEFKADKAVTGALDYIDLRFGKKVFYKFK